MRDPILGAILAQDEMIDRKAEEIGKEKGIKDPVEARMEAIAEQIKSRLKSGLVLTPEGYCQQHCWLNINIVSKLQASYTPVIRLQSPFAIE